MKKINKEMYVLYFIVNFRNSKLKFMIVLFTVEVFT